MSKNIYQSRHQFFCLYHLSLILDFYVDPHLFFPPKNPVSTDHWDLILINLPVVQIHLFCWLSTYIAHKLTSDKLKKKKTLTIHLNHPEVKMHLQCPWIDRQLKSSYDIVKFTWGGVVVLLVELSFVSITGCRSWATATGMVEVGIVQGPAIFTGGVGYRRTFTAFVEWRW
jgi:hypothetical protein